MSKNGGAVRVLLMNTLAFTACFAVWTMYGVLITYLVDRRVFAFDKAQVGWLIGIPVLTGSLLRLPVGILTDKFGGKPVFIGVMLFSAASVFLVSYADSFLAFALGGLAFGTSGAGFAVGIAYSSLWFPKERQGTALGVFGVGNAGSAATTLLAPLLLKLLTDGGTNVEGWRTLPRLYAAMIATITIIFALTTTNKKPVSAGPRTLGQMLRPLRDVRVWRFGLYYFLVFGAFVGLAQWLVPYYLNVYNVDLATAGLLASVFSLPSGIIRALGGWVSDRFGARATMYWVLSTCAIFFFLLVAPRMTIESPGEGILADRAGTVVEITPDKVVVDDRTYDLKVAPVQMGEDMSKDEEALVFPSFSSWQQPARGLEVGQKVVKKQLLAEGKTRVFFQANMWIFTGLVFLAGMMMGVGKAAVYKHIPEYFPRDVGVVGGIVGVLGGLGGFFCPILFGYMLKGTGVWTTCWLFLGVLAVVCLVWMHIVILRMTRHQKPVGALDGASAHSGRGTPNPSAGPESDAAPSAAR
ncbi:MAG: NarK/NasA family nitrate transporter [Polyangiaceae bacterium]|nr:NarK/NasA family nitrate transporter [Polyangiaceae bacterium]